MYVLAQLRIKFWLLSKHSGKWFLKNLVKNCTTKMIFIAATGFCLLLDYANGMSSCLQLKFNRRRGWKKYSTFSASVKDIFKVYD